MYGSFRCTKTYPNKSTYYSLCIETKNNVGTQLLATFPHIGLSDSRFINGYAYKDTQRRSIRAARTLPGVSIEPLVVHIAVPAIVLQAIAQKLLRHVVDIGIVSIRHVHAGEVHVTRLHDVDGTVLPVQVRTVDAGDDAVLPQGDILDV